MSKGHESELEEKNKELKKRMEALKQDYEFKLIGLQERLNQDHKSKLRGLQQGHESQLDTKNKELEALRQGYESELSQKIEELKTQHTSELNKKINKESEKYEKKLKDKTEKFQKQIKELSDEKDRLESEKNKIIKQLEKQIQRQISDIINLTDLDKKNKGRIEELEDKIAGLQENLGEEQRLKNDFEIELSEKMTEIESIKPSKSILEAKVKLLNNTKFLDQKTLVQSLKDDIQKYEDEISNYQMKSDEKDKEIVKINDELLHKDKKINNIKEGLNRLANSLLKSSYKQPTLNLR